MPRRCSLSFGVNKLDREIKVNLRVLWTGFLTPRRRHDISALRQAEIELAAGQNEVRRCARIRKVIEAVSSSHFHHRSSHRSWCFAGRVDQGRRPPRPPTDPDVPNSGIRLVMSRLRYGAPYGVDRDRWRKRTTLQKAMDAIPRDSITPSRTGQPALPYLRGRTLESSQCTGIPGDAVVREVPIQMLE